MPGQLFAVVIHPNAPQQLLETLRPYAHSEGTLTYCFSTAASTASSFVELELVHDKLSNPTRIQIPTAYVLAILELTGKTQIGFLRGRPEAIVP